MRLDITCVMDSDVIMIKIAQAIVHNSHITTLRLQDVQVLITALATNTLHIRDAQEFHASTTLNVVQVLVYLEFAQTLKNVRTLV